MAITFTSPVEVEKPAMKAMVYSFIVTPDSIIANINYYALDGSIVKQESVPLDETNYNALIGMKVKNNHLGKNLLKLVRRKIQNRIKIMKNFDGTED